MKWLIAPLIVAGVDSGANHAGTISGIHKQTFDGADYKPDGTFARAIKPPGRSKDPVAADKSMMSTNGLDKVFRRHAWNIAIEVRDLLTQKTGRKITCNII